MGRGVRKKIRARHGEGGIIAHYCAISPSQPPFISYNIAQYIFPTTPFIAIKYWQYLVRGKGQPTYLIDKNYLIRQTRTPATSHIKGREGEQQLLG